MKPTTRLEYLWLLKNGHIEQERGQQKDVVTSNGKSKKKTRFVLDSAYEKLKDLKDYRGLK